MITDYNGTPYDMEAVADPYLSPNAYKEVRYSNVTPYEQGYPLPNVLPNEDRVPGDGAFPVPHFQTFNSIVNYVSRTHRWRFDEALRDSHQNALAMRRDPVIMHALRMRQIPTAQLTWHLEGDEIGNAAQDEGIQTLTKIIKAIPNFQQLKMNLLESIWWGRAGVLMKYGWDYSTGSKRMIVRGHTPIMGDKLVFKFDGREGVLVHPASTVDYEVTERGRAHFFTPQEREQVIIHRFEPEDADFWEPEFGGAIAGLGVRTRIYWIWYLKQQVLSFMMDFLERVGAGGFTIYYYEHGNERSRQEVIEAAKLQMRNNTIIFPRSRGKDTLGPGVERVEPSLQGSNHLFALIDGYFDNLIRLYILGQSLSSTSLSQGASQAVAGLHNDTFNRIVNYDAIDLEETFTQDLVRPLQKYNCPDCPPLRFKFEIQAPNARELMEAGKLYYDMGGSVDEEDFRAALGVPRRIPGNPVLSKLNDMQPQLQGQMPIGVPMSNQAGPQGLINGQSQQVPTQSNPAEQGASEFLF